MSEHWNIQVNIQKVTETEGSSSIRGLQGKPPVQKTVLQIADIKVQAETETEAYAKVRRLVDASRSPAFNGGQISLTETVSQPGYPTEGSFANPRKRPVRDNPQA
jgi:hypothetical protein